MFRRQRERHGDSDCVEHTGFLSTKLPAIKAIAKCHVNIILPSASAPFLHKQRMKTPHKWDIDCIMMFWVPQTEKTGILAVSCMHAVGNERDRQWLFLWFPLSYLQSGNHSGTVFTFVGSESWLVGHMTHPSSNRVFAQDFLTVDAGE